MTDRMTAVAKLPEKWREAAKGERDYYADALRACADELTAALSPAELGGVELQRWSVIADGTGGVEEFKNVSGRWVKYSDVASTSRAAEAVTEEMVERAVNAYLGSEFPALSVRRDRIRAALTASLTPPSAKGE